MHGPSGGATAWKALSGVAIGSLVWTLPCLLFAAAFLPGIRGTPQEILAHAFGYWVLTGLGPFAVPLLFGFVGWPAALRRWELTGALLYLSCASSWALLVVALPDVRRMPRALLATLAFAWHLAGAVGGLGMLLFGGYALSTM
jgi:hypothetical protein